MVAYNFKQQFVAPSILYFAPQTPYVVVLWRNMPVFLLKTGEI